MNLDSSPSRDARLSQALECLRKPERRAPPPWTALAASTALAGAAVLLALVIVFQPGISDAASRTGQKIDMPGAAPSSAAPGFELSGNEISADAVPVRDAVVMGTEER